MKNILIALIVLVVLGGGAYWYMNRDAASTGEGDRVGELPNEQGEQPAGSDIVTDTFAGTLEEVNTGCFADGECYVVVDGKHVTVLWGFNQQTVGSVQGVDSIGDLESHIGDEVEVYAQENTDGTYTLYGSAGFYVKLY